MTSEGAIFYGTILFMWCETLWNLYLSFRQRKIYTTELEVPNELRKIMTKETYDKARVYGMDRNNFSMIKELIGGLTTTVLLMQNGLVYFWASGGLVVGSCGFEKSEILQSAAFILILNTFNTIMSMPFNVYDTFVLEERHGFNKQTIGFFIKDKIKGYIVSHLIVLPLTCGIVYIVKVGGDYFFIFLWLFCIMVSMFLLTIYPSVIAPLFDKYTPLPDGELKTRIEQLAASIHFPLYKLYVVEGSKRSVHSNAFFFGLFKQKRIVLFDTLLKDYTPLNENADDKEKKEEEKKGCDNEEVLAVLGHELGHWKLNHMLKNVIVFQLNMFLLFVAFGFLFKYNVLYRAFGFDNEEPVLIGITVILYFIFSPYHAVLHFFMTSLSRRFEFQADAFAKSLGKAVYLRRALIKLNQDNLGYPVYDWLFSMWHHTHPPLLERLKALDKTE